MNYVIASVTKQSIFLTFSILLALLAACGDESSSSVSPEPRQCEEQSDDCDNVSSSSEKISKNSSSSQKSADKDKSSSSEKSAKESSSSTATVKNSSSSAGDNKSSSSIKKEDSSSSEEVKQSSSSVVMSSSSVDIVKSSSSGIVFDTARFCTPGYSYCDRSLGADSVQAGAYKKFTDTRNGRTYYYLTINGVDKNKKPASVTVMAENLNIGEMVDGEDDQENDAKIERYCYDNDTTNCDEYGGLYQWSEMMQLPSRCNTESCADLIKPNHQGICPKGWRLLTEDDFYVVLHADGNRHGAEDVRATSFGGYNYSGYSLIGAGYNWVHEFRRLKESSYWFYPVEESEDSEMGALAGYQTKSLTSSGSQYTYKTNGFSVRCVMVE
ncbi:major paralogous domain-containing protein [Fibrobacter sp. UWT3]|uniref:FISUMP domain-containing protein n=1 Tax=Fibrobacter sp. UWT3 TaxID=1896225 RepID=UPI000BD1E48E|nr:FISUMP domain-containing protein [Fibrobacter sp. UWT3]SOE57478.1 major paralogous domain-containing protein [Fibrobacter sp. UWT3]